MWFVRNPAADTGGGIVLDHEFNVGNQLLVTWSLWANIMIHFGMLFPI